MKEKIRIFIQESATYVELFISGILCLVIVALVVKMVVLGVPQIWTETGELDYFLKQAMTLAIGIEFVKMLCLHTPESIIEVLLFAIARQMVAEHTSMIETATGVIAIAGLFAIRKFLFCRFDETERIICRGSQHVRHTNRIAGIKIPGDGERLLREVIAEDLAKENRNITIGACVYYSDYALRVDNIKDGVITRVEVIKSI